jgi:hypothetical protein
MDALPRLFVAAPTRAELAWSEGGWILTILGPIAC